MVGVNPRLYKPEQVPPSTQSNLYRAKGTHPYQVRSLSGPFCSVKIGGFVQKEASVTHNSLSITKIRNPA